MAIFSRPMNPLDPMALNKRISQVDSKLDKLAARVGNLERQFADGWQAKADKARSPYAWGDRPGEPFYHDRTGPVGDYADLAGALAGLRPWVSSTVRFSERLTSPESVRTTALQATLAGVCCAGLGTLVVWVGSYPLELIPFAGLVGFTFVGGLLLILDRTDRRALIQAQANKDKRKRQELRVQVDRADAGGRVTGIEFLYVSGITEQQLRDFAPEVLRTENLAINIIGGGGRIFSQGQAQALCTELELLGYASSPRGPQGRKLTSKGRAFFKGLAGGPAKGGDQDYI